MVSSLDHVLAYASMKIEAPILIIEEQRWGIQAVLKKLTWSLTPALINSWTALLESTTRLHSLHTWWQQVKSPFHAHVYMTYCNNNDVIKTKIGHYDDDYAMERVNHKTVRPGSRFPLPLHPSPFVTFILVESLGTRLYKKLYIVQWILANPNLASPNPR